MTHAHLDLVSGIAGDMLLGAILDAGVDREALLAGLRTIPVQGWRLEVVAGNDDRVGGKRVEVFVDGHPADTFDGTEPPAHGHRHLADILALVRGSRLPEPVKARATEAFERLADAEAVVHDSTRDAVHFHEVGDVDAVIDVCGALLGLHLLGVSSVSCGPVPLGSGFARCQHGRIPVPVPATLQLLRGLPTVPAPGVHPTGELVTPTGAALLVTLVDTFGQPPPMRLLASGAGLGRRVRQDIPNVLRLLLGEPEPAEASAVEVTTATVDDLDPRIWGALLPQLLQAGALDASLRPVQGKKGRPAVELVCLAPLDDAVRVRLHRLILTETTTLGLRTHQEQRVTLRRTFDPVSTPFGSIPVKVGWLDGQVVTRQPEFDACVEAARLHGVPVRVVIDAAKAARSDG